MGKIDPNLIPEKITKEDFYNTLKDQKYEKSDPFRVRWYYLIYERIEKFKNEWNKENYEISDDEAILYIAFISQWNRANTYITEIDYDGFKEYMIRNNTKLNLLKDIKIEILSNESREIQGAIANLVQELSNIKGIKYVGATKVLHIRLPELFVPIDREIAGQKVYKVKMNEGFGESYALFLYKVSYMFKGVYDVWKNNRNIKISIYGRVKTFAKVIDEYNYTKVHSD